MAKLVMILLILVTLLTDQTMISDCFQKRDSDSKAVVCIEAEKQALVSFKRDLVDPKNVLSSWASKEDEEEEDCCKWDRIVCDNRTGHVLELNLGDASLSGKISPSLLNLKHLTRLNFSDNNFEGIEIPSFLSSLGSLRFLDLTDAGFGGMIPKQLGNLSNLLGLKISAAVVDQYLYSKSLHWISGLSSLEYLHMRFVNLSEASDHWLLEINNLPKLVELQLSKCELHGSIRLPSYVNLTSLRVLDLSANTLRGGSLLCGLIQNMTNNLLHSIDLSGNSFGPTIPTCLYTFPNLGYLDIGSNGLEGAISQNFANLTSIVHLDLSYNSLQGKIPKSMGNLCNLEILYLGGNRFDVDISEALESLLSGCLSNSLNSLWMENSSFTGQITDRIGEFKNLSSLYLPHNKISGPIPVSFGSLSNLVAFDISSNLMTGVVSEAQLANLTSLKFLLASGNSLTLRVSPDWKPPFNLLVLYLSSWNLGSQFPLWLESQKDISEVDLSNTGISSVIPSWFWNLSTDFDWIDLSRNRIHGEIPDLHGLSGQLELIDLHSNKLSGRLPRVPSKLEWLDLSNNSFSGDISSFLCNVPQGNDKYEVVVLNLGGNLLAGNIPDCWVHWPSLRVLDLKNNNLSGEIPASIGILNGLQSLHLRNNSLAGEIPDSLRNCTSLNGLDLGLNKFIGNVPKWIGSFSGLSVLILRSNELNGHIPLELCALSELQILDVADNKLSGTVPTCLENVFDTSAKYEQGELNEFFYYGIDNEESKENAVLVTKGRENSYDNILILVTMLDLSSNNLSGEIPEELAHLQKLQHLNLSRNHFGGRIPSDIGNMLALESLDLSSNRLSGKIPMSLSKLTFLNYLNLSYNNLSDEIPKSTQIQSLDPSGFIGNQLLCGDPLPNKCRSDENDSVSTEKNQEEEEDEDQWFRVGVGMGFGVGFLGIIVPLVMFDFWRRAYFWFLQEYLWYKILDCFIKTKYIMGISTPVHLAKPLSAM